MVETKLSRWEMYCFFMNAIVGAGIFVIPSAFQQAGVVAAFLILVCVALLSWLLHIELLAVTEKLTLSSSLATTCSESLQDSFLTSQHQWDLSEIVLVLLGKKCSVGYFLCFAFYILGTLTAYNNMFGTAFGSFLGCDYTSASVDSQCLHIYQGGALCFTIIIAVLTAVDYKEQAWLQFVMTALQYFVAAFIVFYCIFRGSTEHMTLQNSVIQPAALGNTTSILIFACLYQMCIPSLLAASHKHHKANLQVAKWVFFSVVCIYGLMGCISSLFLGDIPSNISLLFKEDLRHSADAPLFLLYLSSIVIFTPAADVTTNSAIYGQALAGMIVTSLCGTNHEQVKAQRPVLYRLIRVLCVLPPLLFCSFSTQLVITTQGSFVAFAGNCCVLITCVSIPLCYNAAQSKVEEVSKFELKMRGLKSLNYAIVAASTVFFLLVMSQDFYAVLTT